MAKKTIAMLEAELKEANARAAEAEARAEAVANRPARARYATGLWPNQNRRTERDPAWQGSVRLIIPPEMEAGDALWLDISEWDYDPESSPVKYKKNPPDFSLSLSPSDPSWAQEQEAKYQKARRANGRALF